LISYKLFVAGKGLARRRPGEKRKPKTCLMVARIGKALFGAHHINHLPITGLCKEPGKKIQTRGDCAIFVFNII